MFDRDLQPTEAAEELLTAALPADAPQSLTYTTLLDSLRDGSSPSGIDTPVTRNRRTALRRFIQSVGKSESQLLEAEMFDGFPAALVRYQAWEHQRGTATSTVRSRCSHLRHIQRIAARHAGSTPSFATLLDRAITDAGRSLAWLEQRSGIGALSLSQWRRGIATPGRLRALLPELEAALDLKPGALLQALPSRAARPTGYGVAERTASTGFRKRLRLRAAAFLDIDHFGDYNHHHGDSQGDQVLRSVAQTIRGVARKDDLVFRKGGEELLVVLPHTTREDAHAAAERMRGAVEALSIAHQGSRVAPVVTVTVGIATATADITVTVEQLMEQASALAMKAKVSNMRNRVHAA